MELAKIQEGKKNKSGSSAGLVSARDSILNKSLVPLLAGNSKTFLLCMLKVSASFSFLSHFLCSPTSFDGQRWHSEKTNTLVEYELEAQCDRLAKRKVY